MGVSSTVRLKPDTTGIGVVARHGFEIAATNDERPATQAVLKVADATAISMARDYKLPLIFFSLDTDGTIVKVVAGERIGTTVHA